MKLINSLYEKITHAKYLSIYVVALLDLLLSLLSTAAAVLVTYHFLEITVIGKQALYIAMASTLASILAFWVFRTYRNIIRFSRLKDSLTLGLASIVKFVVLLVFYLVMFQNEISFRDLLFVSLSDAILTFSLMILIRSFMIYVYERMSGQLAASTTPHFRHLLIYGVGPESISLSIRLRNDIKYKVVGFCTYSEHLKRLRVEDLNVYLFEDEGRFVQTIRRYNVEAILFPNERTVQKEQDRLLNLCERYKLKVLVSPPVDSIDGRQDHHVNIREVEVEDLLNRPEISIDMSEVKAMLKDKVILVTGAAGSIGSEICRQLIKVGVSKLVLFDNAETPMHNLRLELEEKYPYVSLRPIIGDVRSEQRVKMVFDRYHPQIVFHAAAYKHVPLMEENPCEAVMVNVFGTQNIANACLKYGVEKMVMISTDKAVNPTNLMGASKRMAEIYVQTLGKAVASGQKAGKTKFITTRFGNVLGSNGSVLPRFREQIAKGGPVTVTHPDIIRFFMSIPEACRLVLEAGSLGNDNEIFVFDMGQPVKIADMAKRMIALSGLREGEDIQIEYTGLRPGEKLYEEVLSDEENTIPTSREKIRIAKAREYEFDEMYKAESEIIDRAREVDIPAMIHLIRELVPEYVSRNSWLAKI
ncbi:MAG: polysaccharide biosynthesis protein [Bacteroidales bacterium]|nr:polysaccharide biosynthesis protein [Bacteroidales bacterium]